jgi:AcrR family transcriptional regulator
MFEAMIARVQPHETMPPKRQSPTAKRPTGATERSAAKRPAGATERPTRVAESGARVVERDGFGRDHVTEIQRARMIAAMIDVVSERGRSDATVAHVVSRSGVSRRTFYEVFDDFEDCFLAALDQSIARASEYVLGSYEPDAKWHVRIRAALIAVLEFLEDEPAMGRLCIVETLGAGRKVHERRLGALDPVIAVVDEGRRESRSATALPPLTGEGVVGGVLSVLHARLLVHEIPSRPTPRRGGNSEGHRQAGERAVDLLALTGPLMGMITLPYLGPAAAHRESSRAVPKHRRRALPTSRDPLRDLQMRLTYRTVRVLLAIAALGERGSQPSNREVGADAGIDDQGQISKLLSRLERLGLIENSGAGQVRGAPNAWALTKRGFEVEQLVAGQTYVGTPS